MSPDLRASAMSSSTLFTGRSLRVTKTITASATGCTRRKSSVFSFTAALASGDRMTSFGEPWKMKWPSAGAASTLCAASAPLTPPRFSTSTCWPSSLPSGWLKMRAMASDGPPAGYGTIRLTGLLG